MGGKIARRVLLAAATLALLCQGAPGWWLSGHVAASEAALELLPGDMPGFFRKSAAAIKSYAADPDLWTDARLPVLRAAERPEHFIDLELLKGYRPPATRAEFVALCGRLGASPDRVGALPYAIDEWYQKLIVAFAEYRRSPSDARVRAKILYIAGILSHYAADAAQPLHCTIHYDGRAAPDGSSPHSGIHARVDALPERLAIAPADAAAGAGISAAGDAFALAMDAIEASHGLVDRVYELEGELPPDADTPPRAEVVEFARERMRSAARLIASLWYSAWVNSAKIALPAWWRKEKG